jgi:hypothetical protein
MQGEEDRARRKGQGGQGKVDRARCGSTTLVYTGWVGCRQVSEVKEY